MFSHPFTLKACLCFLSHRKNLIGKSHQMCLQAVIWLAARGDKNGTALRQKEK